MNLKQISFSLFFLAFSVNNYAQKVTSIELKNIQNLEFKNLERSTQGSPQRLADSLKGSAKIVLNGVSKLGHFEMICDAFIFETGSIENMSKIFVSLPGESKKIKISFKEFSQCLRDMSGIQKNKNIKFAESQIKAE